MKVQLLPKAFIAELTHLLSILSTRDSLKVQNSKCFHNYGFYVRLYSWRIIDSFTYLASASFVRRVTPIMQLCFICANWLDKRISVEFHSASAPEPIKISGASVANWSTPLPLPMGLAKCPNPQKAILSMWPWCLLFIPIPWHTKPIQSQFISIAWIFEDQLWFYFNPLSMPDQDNGLSSQQNG